MVQLHQSLGYKARYEKYVKERAKINPMQASTIYHRETYLVS
jgi:hypothetical protein